MPLRRLLLLAVTATSLQAQPPAVARITLDEAIRLALANNPEFARDAGAVRTSVAAERTARAAYLPTLSLESSVLRATTPSPLGQPGVFGGIADRSAAAGLAANIDLYTGGRRGAEVRRAAAVRDANDAGLLARRYQVTLLAERAVFDALRAADQLKVQRARVARAEQGLAYAKHRHDAGVVTRSDELRARLELSQAKQELAQGDGTLRTARYALGRLVGADGPVDAQGVDSLAPHPLALDDSAIVALVAEQAPLVQSADAAERATTATVRSARARYAPAVQLGGAYRMIGQPHDPQFVQRDAVWAVRLGLTYPLFDGFQRDEAVTRARVDNEVASSTTRDTRRFARAEAQRALETLRVAETRITLAQEGVQVATEDLRVVQVRYQNGAASILDLITSQTNVSGAESSLVDARFDYAVARAELSALAGRSL